MKLDYIEIGTSDFDALVEKHEGNGISIEPLKFYLDALPKKENNIKKKPICGCRISGKISIRSIPIVIVAEELN